MKEDTVGRAKEKDVLNNLFDSKEPEFLSLFGRHRVGKTFLKDMSLILNFKICLIWQ